MLILRLPHYTLLAALALAACSTQGPPRNDAGMIVRRNCGAQTFPVTNTRATPDILMVVDRSSSMNNPVDSTNFAKWTILKNLVNGDPNDVSKLGLLTQFSGKVNWGLALFPKIDGPKTTCNGNSEGCDPGIQSCSCNCVAGELNIGVAAGNEQTIKDFLKQDGSAPETGTAFTPTGSTINALRNVAPLTHSDRANYILLITDGQATCKQNINGTEATRIAIENFYKNSPPVRTYVVGIGNETASNPDALSSWATAGHTARKGALKYYQANTANDLELALNEIVGQSADCTYKLMSPPADPNLIIPVIGDMEIASDAANGYTYDASTTSIIFHGAACSKLQTPLKNDMGVNTAPKLEITYGCPAEVIQ